MNEPTILGPCTLYHADCRDLLPIPCDAVITDPPYGIGRDGMKESTSSHGGRKPYQFCGWDQSAPDARTFELMFSSSNTLCIWGANYFTQHLPPSMGWLVWDKGQDICGSDCELAFTTRNAALRRKVLNRCELAKDGTEHPTQKPVLIMAWSMENLKVPEGSTVLDPFMGAASTAIACIRTGRKFIGIEKERKYFDIACERIARELQQLTLPI